MINDGQKMIVRNVLTGNDRSKISFSIIILIIELQCHSPAGTHRDTTMGAWASLYDRPPYSTAFLSNPTDVFIEGGVQNT